MECRPKAKRVYIVQHIGTLTSMLNVHREYLCRVKSAHHKDSYNYTEWTLNSSEYHISWSWLLIRNKSKTSNLNSNRARLGDTQWPLSQIFRFKWNACVELSNKGKEKRMKQRRRRRRKKLNIKINSTRHRAHTHTRPHRAKINSRTSWQVDACKAGFCVCRYQIKCWNKYCRSAIWRIARVPVLVLI